MEQPRQDYLGLLKDEVRLVAHGLSPRGATPTVHLDRPVEAREQAERPPPQRVTDATHRAA